MVFLHPEYGNNEKPLSISTLRNFQYLSNVYGFLSMPIVCRKCIKKKLSDEEMECCPVCNIDLGCVPMEKLRLETCYPPFPVSFFSFIPFH